VEGLEVASLPVFFSGDLGSGLEAVLSIELFIFGKTAADEFLVNPPLGAPSFDLV
jgi:hypothetical protein